MRVLKVNIIFTPNSDHFKAIQNGYIVLNKNKIINIYNELPEKYKALDLINYSDKLIIPSMNDLHCHAPQFRNIDIAMDKEFLPWLNNYTFPEEIKFEDEEYAKDFYSRFVKEIYKNGTRRVATFATIHKDSTSILMDLFIESGLGAYIGKVNMDRYCCDSLCEGCSKSIHSPPLFNY